MLNLDATFLIIFLSFIVFMLAMKQVYFDPMRAIKAQREQKILDDQQSAQAFLEQHGQLHQGYEAQLREARQKAQQIILEFRESAKKSAMDQIATVREESRVQLDRQMADLVQWREEAYQDLASEKAQLVESIIGKIYAEKPARASRASKTPATSLEH